jgi:hypothetical protein
MRHGQIHSQNVSETEAAMKLTKFTVGFVPRFVANNVAELDSGRGSVLSTTAKYSLHLLRVDYLETV